MKTTVLFTLGLAASLLHSFAATFVVTTNVDSGPGSLRQAILDANATSTADAISFNITAGGMIIQPVTTLPKITATASIDGLTQPGSSSNTSSHGFNGTILIQIDGQLLAGREYGLDVGAFGCLVRGLSIYNFRGAALALRGGGTNRVESCLLGVHQSGSYFGSGVEISGSIRNTVGGATDTARNVISGNGGSGILLAGSHGNVVLNNLIGADRTGTLPLGNGAGGINIDLSSRTNVIGGATPGMRNVISGNSGDGIFIRSGFSNVIQGNFIGPDAGGVLPLPNSGNGVVVDVGAGVTSATRIGGGNAGEGNTIAFNNARGVAIGTGSGNPILGNAIFSNSFRGISLGYAGTPFNDLGDADAGPNDSQNYPVLNSVTTQPGAMWLSGRLDSKPSGVYRIEFFDNTECHYAGYGPGRTYLGFLQVTNDGSGSSTFTFIHPAEMPFGHVATVTATDTNGNTSEFSPCEAVVPYDSVDLQITVRDAVDPISLAAHVVYTIALSNAGPANATSVVVTNRLPAELAYVQATPSQGVSAHQAGVVTCQLGAISNGGIASITLEAAPVNHGSALIQVSAGANQLDRDPDNNTAFESTALGAADLAVFTTHTPEPVIAGQTLKYVLTATNRGPDMATETVLVLFPDPTLVVLSAAVTQGDIVQTPGQVGASVGSLAPGGSVRLTVTALPTEQGTVIDFVVAQATQSDPDSSDNTVQGETTVLPGAGVLSFQTDRLTVNEGAGTVLLKVVRSGGAIGTVTVDFATSNLTATAGSDFVATAGTLTFAHGELTRNISIPITEDVVPECNEQFLVSLHHPGGGSTLLNAPLARVLIFENDLVPTGQLTAVSVTPGPTPPTGNGYSSAPQVSADGRFIAFASQATDLVAGDTNGDADVFVRDLSNHVTVLASANLSNSGSGAGPSDEPRLSADGRRVAFITAAPDLVAGDTNAAYDVILRDLVAGTNVLISVNRTGVRSGNKASFDPDLSSDGRFVAFASLATDLVTNDLNGDLHDVFLRDTLAGPTELCSVNAAGSGSANGSSVFPKVSPDGRFVVFRSEATDLGPLDTNGSSDVYLRDRLLGTNILVSATAGHAANGYSDGPALSANGKVVVFRSYASDLAPGDQNNGVDIFAYNIESRTLRLVSANRFGTGAGNGESFGFSVSADGRFVAFDSSASDLVPGDANNANDIFVRDLVAGTITLVSAPCGGNGSANRASSGPAISGDGRFVSFSSAAADLTPGQFLGAFFSGNIFRRDLILAETLLISRNTNVTGGANAESYAVQSSADGRVLAFSSGSSDLVAQDLNGTDDVIAWSGPVSPSVSPPVLNVTRSGASVVVRWPSATPSHFLLEAVTSLNPAPQWSPVTRGITNDGVWKSYTATNAMPDPQRHFRLRY